MSLNCREGRSPSRAAGITIVLLVAATASVTGCQGALPECVCDDVDGQCPKDATIRDLHVARGGGDDGDGGVDGSTDGGEDDGGSGDDGGCVPQTCESLPDGCGLVDDGCGGAIECGGCDSPLSCGEANRCECVEPDCRILCDGETFDGFDSLRFNLQPGDSGVVIRDCVFQNAHAPAIAIRGASDVLIEGCRFDSLRSGEPGRDLHAINVPSEGHGVTIRGCEFVDIGADGVQLGHYGADIDHVYILDNVFWVTSDDVGENAIDIKATTGPIVVAGNDIHGFRPCEGGQDCSGSEGAGMVVHSGSPGPARGVTVTGNRFWDCRIGLVVSSGSQGHPPRDIVVASNWFLGNLHLGVQVFHVRDLDVSHNTFADNEGYHLWIRGLPVEGGTCRYANNLFVGDARVDEECSPFGNLLLSLDEAGLVDVAGGDLHLTAASPAVDAAADIAGLDLDFDGEPRPYGAGRDVGADELR